MALFNLSGPQKIRHRALCSALCSRKSIRQSQGFNAVPVRHCSAWQVTITCQPVAKLQEW